MAKNGEIELSRLKNLLLQDKVNTPTQFAEVIKSDLYGVLSGYMELYSDDLSVAISADERGFLVAVEARTARFKPVGMLPKPLK
jgi:septum formation topological specificity factor MinE